MGEFGYTRTIRGPTYEQTSVRLLPVLIAQCNTYGDARSTLNFQPVLFSRSVFSFPSEFFFSQMYRKKGRKRKSSPSNVVKQASEFPLLLSIDFVNVFCAKKWDWKLTTKNVQLKVVIELFEIYFCGEKLLQRAAVNKGDKESVPWHWVRSLSTQEREPWQKRIWCTLANEFSNYFWQFWRLLQKCDSLFRYFGLRHFDFKFHCDLSCANNEIINELIPLFFFLLLFCNFFIKQKYDF